MPAPSVDAGAARGRLVDGVARLGGVGSAARSGSGRASRPHEREPAPRLAERLARGASAVEASATGAGEGVRRRVLPLFAPVPGASATATEPVAAIGSELAPAIGLGLDLGDSEGGLEGAGDGREQRTARRTGEPSVRGRRAAFGAIEGLAHHGSPRRRDRPKDRPSHSVADERTSRQ